MGATIGCGPVAEGDKGGGGQRGRSGRDFRGRATADGRKARGRVTVGSSTIPSDHSSLLSGMVMTSALSFASAAAGWAPSAPVAWGEAGVRDVGGGGPPAPGVGLRAGSYGLCPGGTPHAAPVAWGEARGRDAGGGGPPAPGVGLRAGSHGLCPVGKPHAAARVPAGSGVSAGTPGVRNGGLSMDSRTGSPRRANSPKTPWSSRARWTRWRQATSAEWKACRLRPSGEW